ncbi:MAG: hypothetical protein CEN92_204 [Candidatus Berkelbacteria bacterium Licking1014_96]|uniref:Uncharacterized protein n=1 Tax=Candidatus Berkelbacteria bacterium Licking1014_96 TaxID=2017149 RepID=A0A554LFT0_9BACT|nr:MAG: hypothetical protein CEN92_204 [Candidatus Berkelbacteria bacterium Licking1014_96]
MKELTYKQLVETDIFDLIGAPKSISKDEKEALILKMYQTIENRVIAKIMDRLSDEEIKEFDQKMQLGQKEAFEYLKTKDIDFNKLVLEESIILKTELADLAKNHGIKR